MKKSGRMSISGQDVWIRGEEMKGGRFSVSGVFNVRFEEESNSLIAAAQDMQDALKRLVNLLKEEDSIEVGCYCTNTRICAWCEAKKALRKSGIKGI